MTHDIWIPAVHRDMTGGTEIVQLEGATVGEVIDGLDERYPGIKARLCDGDKVRPHIAVAVNGIVGHGGARQRLKEPSEIHFIPAMSGGVGSDKMTG